MKIFITIILLIYLSANAYIFVRGWQAIPTGLWWRIAYGVLFFICSTALVVYMSCRTALPTVLLKGLYFTGSTWLAIMLYTCLFFLLTDVVHLLNHFFRFLPGTLTPLAFHRLQVIAGCTFTIILLCVGYYRFNHPVIVEKDVFIHKDGGRQKSLKIVAASDIHLGHGIDKRKLQRYVQLINAQKPDMILLAGDVVDATPLILEQEKMHEEINRLEAPLGIYCCLGNHEFINGIEGSLNFLKKTRLHLLVDSAVSVGNLRIIGRNDRSVKSRKPLTDLVAGSNPQQTLLLLDHQPYHLEEAEQCGIDLQFSGHTHDGQLFPLNLLVKRIYELGHGYKQKGNTHIFVSSGLGLWGPPYRIGTQSELWALHVHFD
jgi:predicted MPP superfamily phosphohydrolase